MNIKQILSFAFMLLTVDAVHAQDYELVWSDEFDTNTLGTNWNVEVTDAPYNNEKGKYYEENVPDIASAVKAADSVDVVIACIGENSYTARRPAISPTSHSLPTSDNSSTPWKPQANPSFLFSTKGAHVSSPT